MFASKRFALLLCATLTLVVTNASAQSSPKLVDEALLAAQLPVAWGKLERHAMDAGIASLAIAPHASAAANYTRGSTADFEVTLRLRDDGQIAAGYYKMSAKYLTEDYRDDTQHSLVLAGGQRAEVTEMGDGIFMIETFIADRFVVSANCSHATEAQCKDALERFDFEAISRINR